MAQLGVAVAVLAIALTVTFLVMSEGKDQMKTLECDNVSDLTTCGYGVNATSELQSAVDDIPGWVPLIVIAVIGSILLGTVALFKRAR